MFGRQKAAGEKKRRLRIHEVTHENDIRYRGPLSYQHFQVLGWLCIIASQVLIFYKLGARFDPQLATDAATIQGVLEEIASFSLPFLLIANFAQILDARDGYRKQLIKNAGAMVLLGGVFYALFYRYFAGGIAALIEDPSQALPTAKSAISSVARYGFADFNIFVDLFLCTLVMLFLNYRPKRVFTGKWVIVFRLFALLPIAYEVCCMALKIRAAEGLIQVPVWVYPFLTVKPPMTFVLFVALTIFVKTRELRFRRHGKTHEEYQAFLKTRRNSWNFSVFLAIMMVVVSIVDFCVLIGFAVNEEIRSYGSVVEAAEVAADEAREYALEEAALLAPDTVDAAANIGSDTATAGQSSDAAGGDVDPGAALNEYLESDEAVAAVERGALISLAVGFGGSVYLMLLAPFVLLFSYTRIPKHPFISLLIPLFGIILIVVVYFEGTHQLLFHLPIQKVDLNQVKEYVALYASMLQ